MNARHVDLILAIGVASVVAVIISSGQGGVETVSPIAYLWAIGLGLLMTVRRTHPILVLLLTTIGYFIYHAAGFPAAGVAVPISAALYSAAEMGYTRAAVLTGFGTLAGATAYRVADRQDLAFVLGYELASHATLIAAVIALGHTVRTTRQLRLRRDQVTRLLNRQREMDDDARIRDDRLSLARELHDSIGHSLTVASLYAGLAQDQQAHQAQRTQSLAMVRTAISEALSHLRRTVRVLRGGADHDTVPGIVDLPTLIQTPQQAGYDVNLEVAPICVAPPVESAIYRLVQEAITNVLKHSNGRTIKVQVIEAPSADVVVTVSDDGCNDIGSPVSLGDGLSGMRERVIDLGGVLDVQADRTGWRVEARIPKEIR
ncbi:sensor histidine kinase [Blastococcus sp. Marseille-P5729]|uniref:sensor histidine kinase n=1 Tax=Blastococcus sp. Marseille-P5729 TaxID=2086582 RepID=UPI00131B707A|nr:histidine kinase [Blastococcus sp. Marseille-P5729]